MRKECERRSRCIAELSDVGDLMGGAVIWDYDSFLCYMVDGEKGMVLES